MKGLKALGAALTVVALLAALVPATTGAAPPTTGKGAQGEAATPAYRHYVACGINRHATPSHKCPRKSKKGAFFKSLEADVAYSVCVKFPSGKNLCAKAQEAKQGTLYVNKITSTILGPHVVSWFVKGKKVGSFAFRVTG